MGKFFEDIKKNFELKKLLKKTDALVKSFKVQIAVYVSHSRGQVSKLTKEEFDKMQITKFIGSAHEDSFFRDLPKTDLRIDVKTFVIDNQNFALAFHPMVWSVLSTEERIAACRLARLAVDGKDFRELCEYESDGVVMVGKNYQGALNIGSFTKKNVLGNEVLAKICDGENTIKDSFYFNNSRQKKYDTIFSFDSFEEMQYVSPLEPLEEDVAKMTPQAKAYFFDQIWRRKRRAAVLMADDMICEKIEPLDGIFPQFDQHVKAEVEDIIQTNLFVMQTLGSNAKMRDEDYLRIKVNIFNNSFISEYNQLVQEHNRLVGEYKQAGDIISKDFLLEEIHEMSAKLEVIKDKKITLEQAKQHFSEYFYPKPQKSNSQRFAPKQKIENDNEQNGLLN